MNVNLVMTTTDRLDDEPIEDGKLIYTADKPGHYYDAGGVRLNVNSIQFLDKVPDVGELNVLYVTVSDVSSRVHVWNGSDYYHFSYIDVDKTLSTSDQAADAKVVGDKIAEINNKIKALPNQIIEKIDEEYIDEKLENVVFYDKNWVLNNRQYGDVLPLPGTPGRIYFVRVGEDE